MKTRARFTQWQLPTLQRISAPKYAAIYNQPINLILKVYILVVDEEVEHARLASHVADTYCFRLSSSPP